MLKRSENPGVDNAMNKPQSSRLRTQKPPEACPNEGPKFPKIRKKSCEGNGLISSFLSAGTKQMAEEDDDFEESKSGTGSQPKQTKVQKLTKKSTKYRKRTKKQSDIRNVFKQYKNEHAVLHEFLKEHGAAEQIDPDQLQIALAMSRSLVDQECDQKQTPQAGEPLDKDCSASSYSGSSEERRIVSIRTTLEQFGFRCKNSYTDYDLNVIFGSASTKNVKKIKHKRATNLQPRKYKKCSNIEQIVESNETTARETDQIPTADKSREIQGDIVVLYDDCEEDKSKESFVTASNMYQWPQTAFHESSENIFDETDPNPMRRLHQLRECLWGRLQQTVTLEMLIRHKGAIAKG
uniref:Uncharacterized protein n=1 Tax=Anopheles culicifacies TaxID=139723 RepID=A0A182MMH7_9DIPT